MGAYKQCCLEGRCSIVEIASSLRSLWDHIQHVKWINLFFLCDDISPCINVSPPLGVCFILPHPPPLPISSLISLLPFTITYHTPSFPLFFAPHLITRGNLHPPRLNISDGTVGGVTRAALPVCLPRPGMSSAQESSGLTWSGALNSFRRGCHLCTLDKEGSRCRGGSVHLNMNEAYSHHVDES